MLKIRLKKIGRKRINAFRIIAAASTRKRNTDIIKADLGFYQPQNTKTFIKMNTDIYKTLINQGAQPTIRVQKIFNIALKYPSQTCIAKQ